MNAPSTRQRSFCPNNHAGVRYAMLLLMLMLCIALATGCIQTTPHVVKIGLVAPFEGRYREIGYDVIPAVRLAIREWAERHSDAGLAFELVAYDDRGDPALAVEQALRLTVDPDVAIVIGHWREDTTRAALPIYGQAGLPLITFSVEPISSNTPIYNLAPSLETLQAAAQEWAGQQGEPVTVLVMPPGDVITEVEQLRSSAFPVIGGPGWGLSQFYALSGRLADGTYYITWAALPADASETQLPDERIEDFINSFRAGSDGSAPGPLALTAYQAAWLAMQRVAGDRGVHVENTPAGALDFNANGQRLNVPIYLYRWENGRRVLVEQLGS